MDARPEWYEKYEVRRRDTGALVPEPHFTLVPATDPHAAAALRAYADSVETEVPGLAGAIRQKLVELGQ